MRGARCLPDFTVSFWTLGELATEGAMAHYRTAVRLLGPSGEIAQRASALTGLGDAATLAGDYRDAAEAYQASQEAWLRSGDAMAAVKSALGM